MNRLESNNEFIKGGIAGAVSAVAMFFFIELFRWLGITKYGQAYLASDIVFTYKDTLLMNLIGLFNSIMIGSFWGVVIAFLYSYVFTEDYCLLKGPSVGYLLFVFHLGILDDFFHYERELHKKTADVVVILSGYLLYGFCVAYLLKRLKIFKK